ncbi:MAG: 4Fe-4S cluster-binding domain-containing protein [Lachnospiraceae bacterium]|nr:4Fe-4S cluster-binding domain-containing protein [Lachnospiraceae bacterium]
MKTIILYGAGTQNLRLAYQDIIASKGYNIIAIVDKDPLKQGKSFFGTPIISFEKLLQLDKEIDKYDCVITIRTDSVVNEVKKSLEVLRNGRTYTFEEFFIQEKLNRKITRIPQIQTHVVDHCNLNCVRCSHFSPLVSNDDNAFYLNPKIFENDVRRIAELTNGDIDEYQLAGGEPLLHPECYIFPYIVKKYLPNTKVIIITNGTLFDRVDEKFYLSCIENDVDVWVTRYPIAIDYDSAIENLKTRGINVEYGNSGNSKQQVKEMWGVAYKPDGGLDGEKNFECCYGRCFMIRDGYMYLCTQSAYSDIFNRYFGTNMPEPTQSGINIYGVNSLEEITNYLSKKLAFCDYCNTLERMPPIPWDISKREIGEWVEMRKGNS